MARIAIEPFVASIQLKVGPSVVIEVPELPVSDAVAVLALRAQPAPVHVVVLVASVANRRRLVLIQPSGVATLAGGGAMFAQE